IIGNIKGYAAANKGNTVVDLGAGDDALNITSSGTTAAVQFATVLGGAGNDSMRITSGGAMTGSAISGGDGNDTIEYTGSLAAASTTANTITGDAGNDSIRINTGVAMSYTDIDGGTGTDIVRLESSVLKLTVMSSQAFLEGGTDAAGDLIDRPAGDGTTHQIGDMLSLDRNLSVDSNGTATASSGTGTFALGGITTTNTTGFEALHLDYTGGTGMDLIDIDKVLAGFDTKNFEGVMKSLVFTGDSNDKFALPAGFTKVSENIQLNGFTEPFACYKGMVNGQETFIYLETGANAPSIVQADDRFVMYTGSTAANINGKVIKGDVKHNDADFARMVSAGSVATLYGTATINADGTITYVLAANAATLMGTGTTRVLDYITYEYEDSHGITHQKTVEVVVVRDAAGKWTSPDDIDGETHQTYVAFTGADQSASSDTDGVGPIAGNDTVRIDYNLTNSSVNLKSGNDDLTLKGTLTSSAAASISKIDAGDGNDLLTIIGNIKGYAAANKANTVVDLGAGDDALNITSSGTTAAVQFATLLGGAGNDSIRITSAGAMTGSTISGGADNDTIEYTGSLAAASTTVNSITGDAGNDSIRINTGVAMAYTSIDGGTGTDIVRLESSVLKLAAVGAGTTLNGGTDAAGDLIDRPAGDGTAHQIGDMLSLDRNLSVDSNGTAAISGGTGTFAFGGITSTNTTQFEALHLDYTGGTSMDLIDIANVLRDFDTKNFEGVMKSLVFTGDKADMFALPAGFTKVSENIQLNGFTEPFACYKGMVNGQETFIYLETGPNAPVIVQADDRFVMYTGSTAANINSKVIKGDVKHNDADYARMVSTGTVNTLYGKATFNADGTITYVLAANAATLMGTGTAPVKDYITYEYEDSLGITHQKTVEVVVVRDPQGKWISPDNVDGETHQTYVDIDSGGSSLVAQEASKGNDIFTSNSTLANAKVALGEGDDTFSSTAPLAGVVLDMGDGDNLVTIRGTTHAEGVVKNGNILTGSGDDVIDLSGFGGTYGNVAFNGGNIFTGAGNDSVGLHGEGIRAYTLSSYNGDSLINLGDGDDTLSITSTYQPYTANVALGVMAGYGNDVTIQGGSGNDLIQISSSNIALTAYYMAFGKIVIDGGSGNDTLELTAGTAFSGSCGSYAQLGSTNTKSYVFLDGGTGEDLLHLHLDKLAAGEMDSLGRLYTNATVTNFENILLDMEGSTKNSLTLTQAMLDNLAKSSWATASASGGASDANLYVRGDSNDTLNLKATGVTWNQSGTVTEDGRIYEHWQDNKGHDLFVEQQVILITS
ncbi:beta strand repeat-containing protein, partial [Desulfovibrio cuneatus]|uniref:beta strand repeat-containing protein n=1 Tax=Desulfovibrio cuneatus TaxID=159728 RepID=UPI000487B5DF